MYQTGQILYHTTQRKKHTPTSNRKSRKLTKKTDRQKTNHEHFISQVVIIVKADQSIKTVLDSKIFSNAIHKKTPDAEHRPPFGKNCDGKF